MKSSRLVLGVPLAAAITLGLFYFMQGLITRDEEPPRVYVEVEPIEIYKVRPDTDLKKNTDDETREIDEPPEITRPQHTYETEVSGKTFEVSYVTPSPTSEIDVTNMGSCGVPIVRVPPAYPDSAARKGIEGWVKVRFTVNEFGQVKEVHVAESDPPGVFDKAAMNAVKKWKYNPCKGAGATNLYLEVVLNFELE